jgi:hypothetical protein
MLVSMLTTLFRSNQPRPVNGRASSTAGLRVGFCVSGPCDPARVVECRARKEQTMAKVLTLKFKYEDELRKIPATEVKKENGFLIVYDGEDWVAEYSEDGVEYWSLDEAAKTAAA